MAETKARFLANLIGADNTANDFTLPNVAVSGTDKKVLTSGGDGTVTWEETLTAPEFTSMTGSVNEDDQTTLTINGNQFVAGMTIDVYNNSDTKLNTTSLTSNLVSATQITVDIPNNTSTNGFPIASGTVIYLKILKSGLSVNTSNITVNADPVWGSVSNPHATSLNGATGNIGSALTAPTISSGSGTITYSIATQPSDGVNKYSINSSRQISVDSTSNSSAGDLASTAMPKTDAIAVRATGPAGATQASDLAVNIAVYQYAGSGGSGANGSNDPYTFTGDGTTGTNGVTYRVHEFWYSGSSNYYDHTFQVYSALTNVEFLVIAGGGSGGVYSSTSNAYIKGNQGSNSKIVQNSDSSTLVECVGGGFGGAYSVNGNAGGAGGSGGGGGSSNGSGGSAQSGEGYAGQTSAGQDHHGGTNPYWGSGGGGGAGGTNSTQSEGGPGVQSYITGSAVTRGGGGGASATMDSPYGWAGGSGGGGAGGNGNTANSYGTQGTDGTGSGGGADDHGVGAGHGGGGAGGYRSAVYVGSTGETSGGGASAQSRLSLGVGTYTMRVGKGGDAVGTGNAQSGRGGHGIIIIRYAI